MRVPNEHGITTALSTYYEYAARGFGPTEAELDEAHPPNEVHRLWTANDGSIPAQAMEDRGSLR